jgi:hypothetical protein
MENMSEEELKILLILERSSNKECDLPTLMRISKLNERKIKYYLNKLTYTRNFLFWFCDTNPGVPERYKLKREGYEFLSRRGYINSKV